MFHKSAFGCNSFSHGEPTTGPHHAYRFSSMARARNSYMTPRFSYCPCPNHSPLITNSRPRLQVNGNPLVNHAPGRHRRQWAGWQVWERSNRLELVRRRQAEQFYGGIKHAACSPPEPPGRGRRPGRSFQQDFTINFIANCADVTRANSIFWH